MLGRHRVEAVGRQHLLALDDAQVGDIRRHDDRAPHAAERAVAAAGRGEPVLEADAKSYPAAMAGAVPLVLVLRHRSLRSRVKWPILRAGRASALP